ncbi:MAG TPA: hypothetical protein VIO64_06165 [Pseudobacteroides sp.]|uniref:hypothetical protein n=1 Tax=Pseudobacteroides sp. TaxID=1968840 RepID=UPI002F947875
MKRSFYLIIIGTILVLIGLVVVYNYMHWVTESKNTVVIEMSTSQGNKVKLSFTVGEKYESIIQKFEENNLKYQKIDKNIEPFNYVIDKEIAIRTGHFVFIFTPALSFIIRSNYNGKSTVLPSGYDDD